MTTKKQQYKVRKGAELRLHPEARKLHEDRAHRLKVRSDKRVPHVEEVSVRDATILMEDDNDE